MTRHRFVDAEQVAIRQAAGAIDIPWQRPPMRPYPVSRPIANARAATYLEDVLQSGWWGYGPVARHLEARCAQGLGGRHGVLATSSCTAALHLALLAEGIGPGDEVILPAFTYVSTAAVVRFVGATPVFADIHPTSLMLDAGSAAKALTPRTRAVMAVHYGGVVGDFEELSAWARANRLTVIEDAAHALGSLDRAGGQAGQHGDYAAFSFAATKPLPSCGGGLLAFAEQGRAERLATLSMLGLTTDTFTRFNDDAGLPVQFVAELGHHYRINDLAAALAVAQLEELAQIRALRMVLVQRYFERLEGHSEVILPDWPAGAQPCWYLMSVRVDRRKRDPLRRWLADRRIDTSVHYPNLAESPAFHSPTLRLPVTETVAASVLSLPLFGGMTLDDVDHVCDGLIAGLAALTG